MLISFEGIDGSGKTTQIELLKNRLLDDGVKVQVFREPGGTEVSEQIRSILLNPQVEIDPVTEMLLFSSARSQLISSRVMPLLASNHVVILDRFYDSTIAYQGYGRECLPLEQIHQINHIASHAIAPDITFYLRVSREVSASRRANQLEDRMEKSGDVFYDKVIAGFDALAASESRIQTIDAGQSIDLIHQQIWQKISLSLSI
ncbi:MAG: dTMP kinase [Balneolales bacterium]|nr:dTMP kinase [Balneolales bacterium]